mgnify:CR=1 FL=1
MTDSPSSVLFDPSKQNSCFLGDSVSRSCAADSMGGVTSYIESYNASLSPLTHTLPDQHREFWDLYHTAPMDHQNGIQIPDILIESIIVDGLVDSGAGFFGFSNILPSVDVWNKLSSIEKGGAPFLSLGIGMPCFLA